MKEFCSIVNIASGAGLKSSPGLSQYCAGKRGVIAMTCAVANEYARHNITVNAICPEAYDTALYKDTPPDLEQLYADMMPQGRIGNPIEAGHLALFLVSDMARAVIGAAIPLDGGESGAATAPVKWSHPEILD
ncbi:MAG: SDR family oxidoreductase [Lachnospiraceae bacterium]|nr:SDR family oxidoreductase [Lachnospiraceae bacterium]